MRIIKALLLAAAGLAAAALLVWFVAPIVKYRLIDIGNITGISLCVWTLLLCISPVRKGISAFCRKHGFFRFLWRAANVVYAIVMIYGAAVTALIIFAAAKAPSPDATAVVLGAQVSPSGAPSRILQGRINAAEKYLNDNPGAKAVLCGGKGSDEVISEAECMFLEMTADGISPDRLYIENKSADTVENFRFARQMIDGNGLNKDIAAVTDGFHQFRAGLIADRYFDGSRGAVCAETEWTFTATYTVREWYALPVLLVKN